HQGMESHLIYLEDEMHSEELDIILDLLGREKVKHHQVQAVQTQCLSNFTKNSYQQAFEKIKHYIEDGDCYQVNLAQRFVSEFKGDSWSHYKTLKTQSPAPYGCFFH